MMNFPSLQALASHLQRRAIPQYKQNLKNALTVVGQDVRDTAFDKVGRYQPSVGQFKAWAPLATSTLAQKQRKGWGMNGNPNTPLYATGKFQRDITFKVFPNEYKVTIGTRAPYIVYTELGTTKMPPRAVFGPAALETLPRHLSMIQQFSALGLGGFAALHFPQKSQGTPLNPTGNNIVAP